MTILAGFFVPHPPIILPEVGRGEETKIQNTIDAYQTIAQQIRDLDPDTIILSSPHAMSYRDSVHLSKSSSLRGTMRRFGAPQIDITVTSDLDLIQQIETQAQIEGLPIGSQGTKDNELDHGSLVPLYFLQDLLANTKIVRISPSGLPAMKHYQIGEMIARTLLEDKRIVWVASGDLSHTLKEDGPYGLTKEGPEFDTRFTSMLASGDFQTLFDLDPRMCERAAVCGIGSFAMMAGALNGYKVKSTLLSYEGTFGVGYAVASFYPLNEDASRNFLPKKQAEDPYVRLARLSLEHYLTHRSTMNKPDDLPPELLTKRHGAFVSIHKQGRLRGCIGTIIPTKPSVADEIIHNAISSGTRDYRFRPISKQELHDLEYSVDVLHPPEPIDSPDQLDVKRYGVIVRHGFKSGLLLPNLDGINSVAEQIDIAKRKAGIYDDEPYKLERFEVVRHK